MKQENAIDVKALFAKLWDHRFAFMITWVVAAIVIGAATYLIPREYKSTTVIIPEYNLQETKEIRDIFYEMNLNMEISPRSDMIVPEYYSKIISDPHFLDTLSAQVVTDQSGKSCTIAQLYPKAKTTEQLYEKMKMDIRCKYSRKDGSSAISAIAKDPCVAQQMAILTRDQLEQRIAAYRQDNTQRNINYYASLPESNQLAQMLLQMEQIRLQQHQPVFITLVNADVPVHVVAPQRIKIVVISLIIITLLMIVWYWRKDILEWL